MRLGKQHRLPGFQPAASILVFVALQSMLRMVDWVGGKALGNLLTHIHTPLKPLWLNTPETCTQTFFILIFFYLYGASRQLSLYECSLSSGCRWVSLSLMWKPSRHACDCVCRHLRGCVCFNARVDTHTRRLWMELIQAGPPRSVCASLAATWVVSQPHHRQDGMSPSDSITHPWTTQKKKKKEKLKRRWK